MGCCCSSIDPKWNHPCYMRWNVSIVLKVWDGQKIEMLRYKHYSFSKGTEIPWGDEIKTREDLIKWLTEKFNTDLWPNKKEGWRIHWKQYDIFKKEDPPKIHEIHAGFDNIQHHMVINEENDWIGGKAKERFQNSGSRLQVFYF